MEAPCLWTSGSLSKEGRGQVGNVKFFETRCRDLTRAAPGMQSLQSGVVCSLADAMHFIEATIPSLLKIKHLKMITAGSVVVVGSGIVGLSIAVQVTFHPVCLM